MKEDFDNIFALSEEMDSKSVYYLTNAILKNDLPGFDYLEFKRSLTNLKSMDMDNTMAIRSAFATASTVGLTKQKLVESARHYMKVLEKEKKQFGDAFKNQMEVQIKKRQQKLEDLKLLMDKYTKEIESLQQKLVEVQTHTQKTEGEIGNSSDKLKEAADKFENTFTVIHSQIEDDIKIINDLL